MARSRTAFWLRYWLPVIVWIGVIAFESTDLMSAQHTGTILYSVMTALFGWISPDRFEIFHHLLRKSGHFLGYGTLAVLSFRALRASVHGGMAWLVGGALLLTSAVASLDEWHQTLIPSRTGSARDVVLDTLGGIVLLLLAVLWTRKRSGNWVIG
jgi:VanZ family protein